MAGTKGSQPFGERRRGATAPSTMEPPAHGGQARPQAQTSAGASGPVRSLARFAAFACFFATLPLYSPNIVALNAAGVPVVTGWFAQGTLGFSIASAVGAAALSLAGSRLDPARLHAVLDGLRGALPHVLYFLGGLGYTLLVALGSDVSSGLVNGAGVVCAALAGLPLVPVCVRWASAFAREGLTGLVGVCGLGIGGAALINLAVAHLPVPASFILHVCLLAAGTFAPLALDVRTAQEESLSAAPGGKLHLRAFLSVMAMPLAGIALSSFVIGIAPTTVLGGAVDTQVLGAIVAGLVVAGALPAARRSGTPTAQFAQHLLIPVAAAVALAACAFPSVSSDAQIIIAYTLFSLVGAIALATACGISNAEEFPRPFVFATLVGTYCLTAVLGLAVGSLVTAATTYQVDVIVALAAVYGVFAVALACSRALHPAADEGLFALDNADGATMAGPGKRATDGKGGATAAGACAKAEEPSLERRAELLAERFGLTPREAEIVRILARGHGCTYVAETLLISKSTVYTHVRNVYRKLDISNHDQLIQLLDQQA